MANEEHKSSGDSQDGDRRPDRGAPGTHFLDLELSQVLYSQAEGAAREAIQDILKSAARERLVERLGPRLERIAQVAADALVDEIQANLGIEGLIEEQKTRQRELPGRIRDAIAGPVAGAGPTGARKKGSKKTRGRRT